MDGDGTYTQVRLPLGVTADMVADRSDRLAATLSRAKPETWSTEAGLRNLWSADKARWAGDPVHSRCCTTARWTSVVELRALRDDVTRRGELLERRAAAKVTRTPASTVSGLHPKIGEEARSLAVKVVKKARTCGITPVS